MAFLDFFTNEDKTQNNEVDVQAPAFSATKVQAALGIVIAGILGAVPSSLQADQAVVIAAIAAGTAVVLGVFGLVAVDIRTRQRAHEATLRYGNGGVGKPKTFQAVPMEKLVLQKGHSTPEYEVKLAMVEDGSVSLVGARDGELISATFKETPPSK